MKFLFRDKFSAWSAKHFLALHTSKKLPFAVLNAKFLLHMKRGNIQVRKLVYTICEDPVYRKKGLREAAAAAGCPINKGCDLSMETSSRVISGSGSVVLAPVTEAQ